MKQFFSRFYHFIWYVLASLIILAAIIVTAIRLSLPGIGSYKNEIQAWLSEYMKYPLVIGDITADWSGWNPNLQFQNVQLLSKENREVIASFEEVSTGINLISSVTHYQIIPDHLSVSGLSLSIVKKQNGSILINNQDGTTPSIRSENELAEWLFNQRNLILKNVDIKWLDKTHDNTSKNFKGVELNIKSAGERRQLNASLKLPSTYGNNLSINIDIFGNPLKADWDGEIFVNATDIKSNELLKGMPLQTLSGMTDVTLWTRWNKAKLIEAYATAHIENMVLDNHNKQLLVNSASVELIAERINDKQWLANLNLSDLKTENGIWPTSQHQFDIKLGEKNNIKIIDGNIGFLRLEDFASLIKFDELITADWQTKINWQSLSGDLENIEIYNLNFANFSDFKFAAEFTDLSLASTDSSHSANKLNGEIDYRDERVTLELNTDHTDVSLGSLFETNLSITELHGSVSFSLINSKIHIDNFSLTCNQIPITIDGRIFIHDTSPSLDLITRINETELENIPSLLPKQTHPKLRNWINEAFIGGKVLSGHALFRGKLDEYPFENKQGTFQGILNVANANLNYNNGWPYVDNLTADITIDNDDLDIESASGYIFDAKIDSMHAQINDFVKGDHHLIVDATLQGQIADAIKFINQSPLKENDSLHEFTTRNVTGKIDLDIALDIPLYKAKSTVAGNITLMNTMLDTNIPGIGLENISGSIQFNRHKAWASNINALYQGKPVTLTIPVDQNNDGESRTIVSGKADKLFIIQQIASFFPSLLSNHKNYFQAFDGETDLSVTIERRRDKNNILQRNITIDSNLEGINIGLPAPFTKSDSELKPLRITTKLNQSTVNDIDIEYADFFSVNLNIEDNEDFSIGNIDVDVGGNIDTKAETDIFISGEIPTLDIDDWVHFLNQDKATKNSNKPLAIELRIDNMILLDNQFNNAHLIFVKTKQGWQATITAENIKGTAEFTGSTDSKKDQLSANLDYLYLIRAVDDENQNNKNSIYDFPNLNVTINDFIYRHIKLGKASISSSKQQEHVLFDKISFSRPDKMQINATGKWEKIDDLDRSTFDIKLEAPMLSGLLDSFSFESTNIDDGKTSISMQANWLDTPMNFNLSQLQGELQLDIKKGQLLDVNPSAGRIFGLLSITTLPRRLTLDFSDLFNEGFAFDSIEGNFSIQDGQAYTNNLFMNAPAADISISGRTGLINEDYDQIATVMPKITSSLPVASALFGPIGVGVGTAIYLVGEVFESIPKNINRILSKQYSIQGNWDNPQIEKLDNKNSSG